MKQDLYMLGVKSECKTCVLDTQMTWNVCIQNFTLAEITFFKFTY